MYLSLRSPLPPLTSRNADERNRKPRGGGGKGGGIGSQWGGAGGVGGLLPYKHTDQGFSLSHLLSEL